MKGWKFLLCLLLLAALAATATGPMQWQSVRTSPLKVEQQDIDAIHDLDASFSCWGHMPLL